MEMYFATIPIIIYATMHLYNNLGQRKEFYYANLGLLFYLFTSTAIFLLYELATVLKYDSFLSRLIQVNILLQYAKFGLFFYQWKLIYFNKND
ncbi:hypothetical protein ACFSX9_04010 [Flavobacterium ardleyense]|uniref:Uncharacterized protein n=1 Tax=Flavobacterium ardleyense TaxID=2038737 RepID=A0ABW5Z6D1_9FLAO